MKEKGVRGHQCFSLTGLGLRITAGPHTQSPGGAERLGPARSLSQDEGRGWDWM